MSLDKIWLSVFSAILANILDETKAVQVQLPNEWIEFDSTEVLWNDGRLELIHIFNPDTLSAFGPRDKLIILGVAYNIKEIGQELVDCMLFLHD